MGFPSGTPKARKQFQAEKKNRQDAGRGEKKNLAGRTASAGGSVGLSCGGLEDDWRSPRGKLRVYTSQNTSNKKPHREALGNTSIHLK
jgi:hypothetical protein